MSTKQQVQILFRYHWHTTQRLLSLAMQLPEEVIKASRTYGRGSIQELFFHLLRADQGWRVGLETSKRQFGLQPEDYPTLEAIKSGLINEQQAWDAYLDKLMEDDIQGDVGLLDNNGNERTFELWRILQHLILHGMQHHSELAQALTELGTSPGDLDFIFYRET
jgi:uncharacterized damage-inducible protein DinB